MENENRVEYKEDIEMLTSAELICSYMHRLYGRGLTTTSGGNISIRKSESEIWISPSGIDKGNLLPHQISLVDLNGNTLNGIAPSSEAPFHLEIYRRNPDIYSVLHAHSAGLVAWSTAGSAPRVRILTSVIRHCQSIGFIPYALPGSQDLAENIGNVINSETKAGILENHGVVTAHTDLHKCFALFETIETAALIGLLATQLGEVHEIDPEKTQIDEPEFRNTLKRVNKERVIGDKEKETRASICRFVKRAYKQNFFISTMGSISVRHDNGFLITPHYYDRSTITPQELVYVESREYFSSVIPSYSSVLHAAIYKSNSSINSIILAQPMHCMAFAVSGTKLETKSIPESYVLLRNIDILPFGIHYTDPDLIGKKITEQNPLIMVQNDCIISSGRTLLEAFDRLEVAEFSARFSMLCLPLGGIKGMSQKQIEEIEDNFF